MRRKQDAPTFSRADSSTPLPRIYSRRALVGWIVLAALLLPFIKQIDQHLRAAGVVVGSESASVSAALKSEFDTEVVETEVLVIGGLSAPVTDDSGRAEIRRLLQPIVAHATVSTVLSPASVLDTMLVGPDNHSAIALVGIKSADASTMPALRAITSATLSAEHLRNASLTMHWTGQSALLADLKTASAAALRNAELVAVPLTIVLAMIAFGSVQAVLLAMIATTLVIVIALGASGLLSDVIVPTALTRLVISLIGFALTMDYVLLLTRWPKGVRHGATPARTVRLAGLVVAIGFTGLAVAPTGELRSAAFSAALVALLASVVATTLVQRSAHHESTTAIALSNVSESRWRHWGLFVTRNPWTTLVASLAPLLVLAFQATTANLATPVSGWLPKETEAMRALDDLEHMQRGGLAGTSRVLLTLPTDVAVLSPFGWLALQQVGDAIRALPNAGDVRSLHTIGTGDLLVAQRVLPTRLVN